MLKIRLWAVAALLLATGLAGAQVPRDGLVDTGRAADFPFKSAGFQRNGDWVLDRNGFVEADRVIVPNTAWGGLAYTLEISASGTPAGPADNSSSWPQLAVYMDGLLKGTLVVGSRTPTVYRLPVGAVNAGLRRLRLAYGNDAVIGTEDRNLTLGQVQLRLSGAPALPGNAGSFRLQSVSILNGFYPSNVDQYGGTEPCAAELTGCRNIQFIKALGGNDVTFTSVCTLVAGGNWCKPQINHNDEERALRVAIRHARALGMTVSLKPFVLAPNGEVLASYRDPVTGRKWLPSNPYEFFDSIEANLVNHARLAREEGVSLLVIGTEFGGRFTSGQPLNGYGSAADWYARWATLIGRARSAAAAATGIGGAPALQLTYAATMAGVWSDIDANEAPYVCFWDQLDYIGLNAYPHMNLVPTQPATTQLGWGFNAYRRMFLPDNPNASASDDMVLNAPASTGDEVFSFEPELPGFAAFDLRDTGPTGFQATYGTRQYASKWVVDQVIDRINDRFATRLMARNKFPLKAIITEVGAPSGPTVQGFWGNTNDRAAQPGDALYLDEQARAWDGYLRAFYADPRIVGLSAWGLKPHHAPEYGEVDGWALGYDFHGKPQTEEVLCQWFKRSYSGARCLAP